ncbi:MAG: hypothetical protein JW900_12660 [Anaerolineae bacterium]|nr:hypothetical protein [Anaerolineae bacterium]
MQKLPRLRQRGPFSKVETVLNLASLPTAPKVLRAFAVLPLKDGQARFQLGDLVPTREGFTLEQFIQLLTKKAAVQSLPVKLGQIDKFFRDSHGAFPHWIIP